MNLRPDRVTRIVASVVLVGGLSVGAWSGMQIFRSNAQSAPSGEVHLSIADIATKGRASAPLAIVVFTDFQCSFCSVFAREHMPWLEKDYIRPGRVLLGVRHYPVSGNGISKKAAESAECANAQGRFWSLHDTLFKSPRQLSDESLSEAVKASGIQQAQFITCMQGAGPDRVQKDRDLGQDLGIRGTPAFLFGVRNHNHHLVVRDRLLGIQSERRLKQILDTLLELAEQ